MFDQIGYIFGNQLMTWVGQFRFQLSGHYPGHHPAPPVTLQ